MFTLRATLLAASLASLALVLPARAATPAIGWSNGAEISNNAAGFDIGLDAGGDVAALIETFSSTFQTRFQLAGGAFGPFQAVSSPSQSVFGEDFKVYVDAAGTTTAVYIDQNDRSLYTSDKPKGGVWQTPLKLNKNSNVDYGGFYTPSVVRIAFNTAGDAIVAWGDAGINVAERRGGGAWSSDYRLLSTPFTMATAAGISEDGAAVLCLESFHYGGPDRNLQYDIFAASSPSIGSRAWAKSRVLVPANPSYTLHRSRPCAVAVADRGRAALVTQFLSDTGLGFVQASAGAPWSVPVKLAPNFRLAPRVQNRFPVDFAGDRAGNATLLGYDAPTARIEAIGVDVNANRWSAPTLLGTPQSNHLTATDYAVAVAPDGFTAVAWWDLVATPSAPSGYVPSAFAITRANGLARFSPTTRLYQGSTDTNGEFIRVAAAFGRQGRSRFGNLSVSFRRLRFIRFC